MQRRRALQPESQLRSLLHVTDEASADEFGTLSAAVFASYNLLIHAAGTDNADLYFRTSTVFLLLSSVSTLLVNVVMLNALIARHLRAGVGNTD